MNVYAVILRKCNICNPTTRAIMALSMVKERGSSNNVRWRLIIEDLHHPFFTYFNSQQEKTAAFSLTGICLSQGLGRMWVFRSRKAAEFFQKGFFAYKLFLGACMTEDDSNV